MPFWNDPDYPGSGPIRVDIGIRATSRRGGIGGSWWSRRFVDVLESLELGGRLTRGRSYARSGQVLTLDVTAGAVVATVQGSRPAPYDVRVELAVIEAAQWELVERAIADQAIFTAKLLAGEMPQDLEQMFDHLGLSLFPDSAGDLSMMCSCPDSAVPCKHVAATLYLLAEAFDRDPFLVLAWRGRGKDDLLRALRRPRGTAPPASGPAVVKPSQSGWQELRCLPSPPLAECVDGFFAGRGRMPAPCWRDVGIVVPDAVLRERDPLDLPVQGQPVTELLRAAYLAMGSGNSTRPPPD
jgi:uncharacterized Zn finger protein